MKLSIAWLYPDLMGTYGDRGNVVALVKRAEWRGITVEVLECGLSDAPENLRSSNLIFMGGAQDRQQKIVSRDILKVKGPVIKEMIEKGIPGLFVCASYQFMGRYYKTADGESIGGLGLFDLYTVNPGLKVPRCIGNAVIQLSAEVFPLRQAKNADGVDKLVGFENHGGRTFLGEGVRSLGRVVKGWGNNGEDKTEGAVYKNAFGCYLHGPLLPRNPFLTDLLISKALGVDLSDLPALDDRLEGQAHRAALRLG